MASSVTFAACENVIAVDVRSLTSAARTSEVSQRNIRAIDVFVASLINKEKVVGAVAAADVDVFPQFDISFRAENDKAPVAPVRKGVGRIPIDANVPLSVFVSQQDFAEVLKTRVAGISKIADTGRHTSPHPMSR